MVEAERHYLDALDLIARLPENAERDRREFTLQLGLAAVLTALKGDASPEVEPTHLRVRELCERLGDPPDELFSAMFGLWAMYITRGDSRKAYEMAQLFLHQAQSSGNRVRLAVAEYILGGTFFWLGKFDDSWSHLKAAVGFFDSERHLPPSPRYIGYDVDVMLLIHSAWTLWHLGYPDQSLEKAQDALTLAEASSHPPNVYLALNYLMVLHQVRGDFHAVDRAADDVIAACRKYGISDWMALTVCLKGWTAAAKGQHQDGIAQQQQFLARSMISGTVSYRPYFLCLSAENYTSIGLFNDGLSAVTEALSAAEQNGIRYFEAETHRLKGELLLKFSPSRSDDARGCFEQAIKIAQAQGSRSLELRATTSLARLLRDNDRRDEARTMLANIYKQFSEGFDTKDLREAKALLEEKGTPLPTIRTKP
jgi:predicted ATPase